MRCGRFSLGSYQLGDLSWKMKERCNSFDNPVFVPWPILSMDGHELSENLYSDDNPVVWCCFNVYTIQELDVAEQNTVCELQKNLRMMLQQQTELLYHLRETWECSVTTVETILSAWGYGPGHVYVEIERLICTCIVHWIHVSMEHTLYASCIRISVKIQCGQKNGKLTMTVWHTVENMLMYIQWKQRVGQATYLFSTWYKTLQQLAEISTSLQSTRRWKVSSIKSLRIEKPSDVLKEQEESS